MAYIYLEPTSTSIIYEVQYIKPATPICVLGKLSYKTCGFTGILNAQKECMADGSG